MTLLTRSIAAVLSLVSCAMAEPLGETPYRGWSSWSLQATTAPGYGKDWLTAERVLEQAEAMRASLGSHGYVYVNIDSFWSDHFDEHGRSVANPKTFPDGIAALADRLHKNGQKLGLYTVPGVDGRVIDANPLIEGTDIRVRDIVFHPRQPANAFKGGWKIDYSKPGAQAYIDSIAKQFAAWGVDFLKLDGMVPGSDYKENDVDSRADAKAWSEALRKTGRPIWLTLSWSLPREHAEEWQKLAHAWRVNGDVERYGETLSGWWQVNRRFVEQLMWKGESGKGKGWCDLDSLPVASGVLDGLTDEEKRTAVTFWAINCSPLYVGGDLTKLDDVGRSLLTNDAILAFNEAGRPARQVVAGDAQVWCGEQEDGSKMVGLFNLSDREESVAVDFAAIGLEDDRAVITRDAWSSADLGEMKGKLSFDISAHACRLIVLRSDKR